LSTIDVFLMPGTRAIPDPTVPTLALAEMGGPPHSLAQEDLLPLMADKGEEKV